MNPQDPSSWRLPEPGGGASEERAGGERARARHRGLRHVRRLSNWTAVGLVAATAVTAGYFARATASATAAGARQAAPASAPQSKAPAPGAKQACTTAVTAPAAVSAPVAVSGGSGVITTVPGRTTPAPSQGTPAPGQACAPGAGSTTPPAAGYAEPRENEKGDS